MEMGGEIVKNFQSEVLYCSVLKSNIFIIASELMQIQFRMEWESNSRSSFITYVVPQGRS